MIGGFAAAIMIFLAGRLKDSLGFAGLLQWVALGCLLAALTLVATARSVFARPPTGCRCGGRRYCGWSEFLLTVRRGRLTLAACPARSR